MKKKLKNNYKLIFICIFLAIIGHSFFLKNQILNDQYMIGRGDQFSQMLIFKDLLYDEFSQGNFFFSFNFNGGSNYFTRLSYYFSTSLVFYITALATYVLELLNIISSTSMVYWASIAVVISIARSFVVLLVTTKFLNVFIHDKKISLLGAIFYAFSSIYFRHATLWEFFGDAMIWLPIILLGVEYIIRKKDGKVFAIGVALTLFNNGYFAFANLLFALIYIILRWLFKLSENEESVLKQIKKFFIYGLIGVGLSLPGFIPFVIGFFSTSRLSPEFTIPTTDLLDFNLGNLLLNDQIQLLPILFIIVITYLLNYRSRSFRFFSVFSFVLIVLRYSPFIASLFNGLSYPQYRWHYITFLIVSLVIALGVKNIIYDLKYNTKKSLRYLAISAIITLSCYYIASNQVENSYFNMNILYTLIIFMFLAFMISVVIKYKRILLFLLIFSSFYTVFVSNKQFYYDNNLQIMNYDKIYNTFDNPNTSFEKSLDIIEEDSERFYRIDFTDMQNLGSQKEFSSFNVYSSFQNRYQQYFYRYFQIINSRENNGIIDGLAGRQTLNSIFQSNYVIAGEGNKYIIPTGFEEISQVDDLRIFKNQIPLAFIHPVKNLYSSDEVEYNDYKDDLIINGAIVPDELSNVSLENRNSSTEELDYTITNVGTEVDGNTLVNSENYYNIDIELEDENIAYEDVVIDYTIKPLDVGETGRYTYSINDYSIQLKSTGDPYSSQLYRQQAHVPYDNNITFNLAPGTDYIFEIHSIYGISHDELIERSQSDEKLDYAVQINGGNIDIQFDNEDNYPLMVLPLFYEKGWDLEINGKKQDVLNVNNGMIGFEIPSGDLRIKLEFKQPLLKLTVLVAIISLGILVFLDRDKKKDDK